MRQFRLIPLSLIFVAGLMAGLLARGAMSPLAQAGQAMASSSGPAALAIPALAIPALAIPALAIPAPAIPAPVISASVKVSAPAAPSAPAMPALALGTYVAHVTRVIDGDTVEARVSVWLGQDIVTRVRLRGIDAPEIRGACGSERDLALAAREALARLIEGQRVNLDQIGPDKYFGRVVARILTADGRDAGALLLADGLARAYDGKRRDKWCAVP